MLHPVVVIAIAVLVLNDHMFKHVAPSWTTGKLSDFAGLLFFPLLLVAAAELALAVVHRWRRPSAKLVVAATALTAGAFSAVKLTTIGADGYMAVLGALQESALGAVGLGSEFRGVIVARDPTDLVALSVLVVPLAIGLARARAAAACL